LFDNREFLNLYMILCVPDLHVRFSNRKEEFSDVTSGLALFLMSLCRCFVFVGTVSFKVVSFQEVKFATIAIHFCHRTYLVTLSIAHCWHFHTLLLTLKLSVCVVCREMVAAVSIVQVPCSLLHTDVVL